MKAHEFRYTARHEARSHRTGNLQEPLPLDCRGDGRGAATYRVFANIKERRDYSCAVFDSAGEVIAMGDHMPVHLGSMPMLVRAAIAACEMAPGVVVMLNDPFRGGTICRTSRWLRRFM